MRVLAIYLCSNQTREECLTKNIFGSARDYNVQKGDICILYDYDNNHVHGLWETETNSSRPIDPMVFGGKYPYQVQVSLLFDKMRTFEGDAFFAYLPITGIYDGTGNIKGGRYILNNEQAKNLPYSFEHNVIPP